MTPNCEDIITAKTVVRDLSLETASAGTHRLCKSVVPTPAVIKPRKYRKIAHKKLYKQNATSKRPELLAETCNIEDVQPT